METQHLTQQSFALALQIAPASLSSIFNDRTKPTLNHVEAIKKRFPNVNISWLLFGDGPMFNDGESVSDLSSTPLPVESNHIDAKLGESRDLFGDLDVSFTPDPVRTTSPAEAPKTVQNRPQVAPKVENVVVKTIDKTPRKISEIRIFYDDQTWETFIPKK